MDIDLLKSVPEDQIEMMLMTWQMDKFPELSAAYADHFNDQMHSMETSPQGSISTNSVGAAAPAQFVDNSSKVASPTYVNQPSTISFGICPADFLSNSSSGCWGNDHLVGAGAYATQSDKRASMAAMREMIFRIAAMQPIHIDPESVKPPKRRNVKISNDPQSVAARHRRERISERIRILQRLVPGGTKMDTASMLDEAIHYVKFLKNQVQSLERAAASRPAGIGFPVPMSSGSYLPMAAAKSYHHHHQQSAHQNVQHFADA